MTFEPGFLWFPQSPWEPIRISAVNMHSHLCLTGTLEREHQRLTLLNYHS